MFILHDKRRLLLDSDSQDILAYFFIQKSKFQSVSCSVPFLRPLTGMQLLQSLRVRLFLAKEF